MYFLLLLLLFLLLLPPVWLGGVVVTVLDLRLEITGLIPAAALSSATLGKLFAHTCLCDPSSLIWYQLKLGSKQAHRGRSASAGVSL